MHWILEHLRTELFKLSDAQVTPLSLFLFLLTLIGTFTLASVTRSAILRFFHRTKKADEGLAYALGRIGQYTILAIGIVFAIDNVGLDYGAFAAVGAVVTVGIGFGMQNIAQNFISGVILLIERPIQKGDFIMVGNSVGTVVAIEMRATKVVSRDGVAIIVPNSELITQRVLNQSSPTSQKRATVTVGVAYGSDVTRVRQTLLDIAAANAEVLKEPPPAVFFLDFADSAMVFDLAVWIGHPKAEPQIQSDIRFAIEREFRANGIRIPSPQREIRMRTIDEPGAPHMERSAAISASSAVAALAVK